MKVIIDLPEKVLKELEKKADELDRSRKNYMELILKLDSMLPVSVYPKKQQPKTKK